MTTYAAANGGTVNSCAASPWNPSPETNVGVKSEKLENGEDIHVHVCISNFHSSAQFPMTAQLHRVITKPTESYTNDDVDDNDDQAQFLGR